MSPPVFQIIAGTQSYDWGKLGRSSKVAQFASKSVPNFEIDENKPYAEVGALNASIEPTPLF